MTRKTPACKEQRRPPSDVPKAPAERLIKLPLGGRPSVLRKGEALPELEYEIDPGLPASRLGQARYFYVDSAHTCATCGVSFVFAASEQKHFFEKLRFPFYSAPIHCPACRRLRRGTKELNDELDSARRELEERPEEPAALLAAAGAMVRLFEETGTGDLGKAIAYSRKAVRKATHSQLGEAAFWEAKAQLLAGRREKALPLFRVAFEKLPGSKRCLPLRAETAAFLAGEEEAEFRTGPASPEASPG